MNYYPNRGSTLGIGIFNPKITKIFYNCNNFYSAYNLNRKMFPDLRNFQNYIQILILQINIMQRVLEDKGFVKYLKLAIIRPSNVRCKHQHLHLFQPSLVPLRVFHVHLDLILLLQFISSLNFCYNSSFSLFIDTSTYFTLLPSQNIWSKSKFFDLWSKHKSKYFLIIQFLL